MTQNSERIKRDQQISALHKHGFTDAEIAAECGTTVQYVKAVRASRGLAANPSGIPLVIGGAAL